MAAETARTILKILSGVQSGVDVALQDGEYTIGSDDGDDIQIFDVSLKPGHARLIIHNGKISLSGASGQLRTTNGLNLEAGGDAQEIEPLDVVIGGTTRFALGPRSANWATVTAAQAGAQADTQDGATRQQRRARAAYRASWAAVVPVVLVLLLVAAAVWLAPFINGRQDNGDALALSDLEAVQEALADFEFRNRLDIRQELDGVVYVTGYVERPVERRAIMGAVRDAGVPARIRVSVLDVIRNEIGNLLSEEGSDIGFGLSDSGVLTLTGIVLDPEEAERLAQLVRDGVSGLSSVAVEIRTAPILLAEIQALAARSQIDPLVQLRLDGELIEASGILPSEKIDAWVGFLQAYSSQFASIISLRSLVQLQNPDGTVSPAPAAGGALYLGEKGGRPGDLPVDIARLQAGNYDLGDVFIGLPGSSRSDAGNLVLTGTGPDGTMSPLGSGTNGAGPGRAGSAASSLAGGAASPLAGSPPYAPRARSEPIDLRAILGLPAGAEQSASGQRDPAGDGRAFPDGQRPSAGGELARTGMTGDFDGDMINRLARRAMEAWQQGELDDSKDGLLLKQALETLDDVRLTGASSTVPILKRYALLMASERQIENPDQQCWHDSRVTRRNVVGALFWLDLMSVSADLSVVDLDEPIQGLLLEAALNPAWTGQCATAVSEGASLSVYLYEIARNPSYIGFITRDYPVFPLQVSGAHIVGERYLQTRSGRKMGEGSAPDVASRLLHVGALGAVVERSDGLTTVIFDSDLTWLIR